jgi:hypothetical protein
VTPLLPWHDSATRLGVRLRVYFFDPELADAQADPALRALPILLSPTAPTGPRPQALTAWGDLQPLYRAGALQAQPRLVLRHGEGLISVLHLAADQRRHEPSHWRERLRLDQVLQAIATAMAVAGHLGQTTVPVWRTANALYLLDAQRPLLQFMADALPDACRWWQQPAGVTAAQLASFCEPRWRVRAETAAREPAATA